MASIFDGYKYRGRSEIRAPKTTTDRFTDIAGRKFGNLSVEKFLGLTDGSQRVYGCLCDCGERVAVISQHIIRKRTYSCGCSKRLAPGVRALRQIMNTYKFNAARRGYMWELTEPQFVALGQQNCIYCGSPPMNRYKSTNIYADFRYSGVDRIDNSVGYTVTNSVSCCGICNRAKSSLSLEDWISWLNRMIAHRTSGGNR